MIEVKLLKKSSLKGYTFIEGFPGVGLVGPMAISYLIDKLDMEYIGYIESSMFPPLIAIHGNKPMPPIRMYSDAKTKIFAILAEFAIPINATSELSKSVYDFVRESGIGKIVSIAGIPNQIASSGKNEVFSMASTDSARKEAQKAGMKPVVEGVATGTSALILMSATLDAIPDINILVPVDPSILDPKYAETAMVFVNKLLSLNIDITELDKEAKQVEEKIRELLQRNRQVQDAHKKAVDAAGPSMYA
jgi:uncharacterized protein